MKVSLNDVKIGEKIKVEIKSLAKQDPEIKGDLQLQMLDKYEGELIDVQDNIFAIKNGELILIFDTDLYEIFDSSKKECLIINLSFEGKNL